VPKIPIAAISVCCENGENSHGIGENELFERESDPSKDLEQLETNYNIFSAFLKYSSPQWLKPLCFESPRLLILFFSL